MARSVSRIYFGNILGSAMGPLLTGFVALDFLSIDQCFAISAIACSVLCGLCILNTQRRALVALPLSAVLAGAIFLAPAGNGSDILAHLAHQGSPLTHFVANRYGVVHTTEGLVGDVVYGGNIYDGMTSTDVDRNSNRLDRVYMLALLHPRPRRALVIGMSTGAWTRVLEAFPDLESMDIVEINPAYVSVSSDYSNLTPLLRDPRLKLHIDDGRRWLKRNPGLRFDLIVQNTTFHWRANLTNLLSREYFTDVRRHLNPGGILTVNTTGSFDVLATGAAVFSHAYRYANFMYASDTPLTPVLARLERVMRPDGRPFTFQSPPAASVAALLRQARLEPVESFMAQQRASGEVITDDNLLPEFRHGRVYGPESLYPFYRQPALFNMDAP
jgi:spermidine synthase